MTNDSLVSIVNTTVYGRSKQYNLEGTGEVTLVQWAVETKQLLLASPELAGTVVWWFPAGFAWGLLQTD